MTVTDEDIDNIKYVAQKPYIDAAKKQLEFSEWLHKELQSIDADLVKLIVKIKDLNGD